MVARFNGVEEVVSSNLAAPTGKNAASVIDAAFLFGKRQVPQDLTGFSEKVNMNIDNEATVDTATKLERAKRLQRILSLVSLILGLGLCIMAISVDFVDRSSTPGFGAVQMLQFLLGVSCLTLTGFVYLYTLRQPDAPKSLQADIGIRLGATGLVFMYVAGFADLIGIGTHVDPSFSRPFAGPLQLAGLFLGVFSISAGMLLYHSSRRISGGRSSMDFLVNDGSDQEEPTAQS